MQTPTKQHPTSQEAKPHTYTHYETYGGKYLREYLHQFSRSLPFLFPMKNDCGRMKQKEQKIVKVLFMHISLIHSEKIANTQITISIS